MIETMRRAEGARLAAPQVGQDLRLFVADLLAALQTLEPEERPEVPTQAMVCSKPPDLGHLANVEAPAAFNGEVRRFIR